MHHLDARAACDPTRALGVAHLQERSSTECVDGLWVGKQRAMCVDGHKRSDNTHEENWMSIILKDGGAQAL